MHGIKEFFRLEQLRNATFLRILYGLLFFISTRRRFNQENVFVIPFHVEFFTGIFFQGSGVAAKISEFFFGFGDLLLVVFFFCLQLFQFLLPVVLFKKVIVIGKQDNNAKKHQRNKVFITENGKYFFGFLHKKIVDRSKITKTANDLSKFLKRPIF